MSYETVPNLIIGSGAAGLNCAIHLVEEGIKPADILIVTENVLGSTSYNTGSDKQTYYKLGLYGDSPDSPVDMARDLMAGGAMQGDIAIIEANLSAREFFHLVNLGVPFPCDRHGGYVGYKTDNDPRQRATSVGPYTSQEMVKALLKRVKELGIPILEKCWIFKLVNDGRQVRGAIGFKLDASSFQECVIGISATNIILATGGPASMYKRSVYPEGAWGSLGLGVEARAEFRNLTECQFGLAATRFRWNLSGSYQQVLPRYISAPTFEDCLANRNVEEFLREYFPDMRTLLEAVFLKGYEWPFNSEKVKNWSSSLIDLAVNDEIRGKRRVVCLDFRTNHMGTDLSHLPRFPREYLAKSEALQMTPIARLRALNPKAIQIFLDKGIDPALEPIQVDLCAQHMNGGYACNIWWETSIPHLFAIGEANGSHGVHRPGGAALNAGQVGGLRAAQFIARNYPQAPLDFESALRESFKEIGNLLPMLIQSPDPSMHDKLLQRIAIFQTEFSEKAGIMRSEENLRDLSSKVTSQLNSFLFDFVGLAWKDLPLLYKFRDLLYTQWVTLYSMIQYLELGGGSRGSALIIDGANPKAEVLHERLNHLKVIPNNKDLRQVICHVYLGRAGKFHAIWLPVRPIPDQTAWFETTWHEFEQGELFR